MPLSVKNAPVQCPVTVKSTLHKLHLSMFEYTNADVWRERPVQTNINTMFYEKDTACKLRRVSKFLEAGKYTVLCLASM